MVFLLLFFVSSEFRGCQHLIFIVVDNVGAKRPSSTEDSKTVRRDRLLPVPPSSVSSSVFCNEIFDLVPPPKNVMYLGFSCFLQAMHRKNPAISPAPYPPSLPSEASKASLSQLMEKFVKCISRISRFSSSGASYRSVQKRARPSV